MKYLTLLLVLFTTSCSFQLDNRPEAESSKGLPRNIFKFEDDVAICYTYYQHSISCVPKPSCRLQENK